MEYLRERGWVVDKCEHWNPWSNTRKDLFGFGDIIGVHPEKPATIFQATTGSNLSKRIDKIKGIEAAALWVEGGNRIQAWGWRKLKPRTGGRELWVPRRVDITLREGQWQTFEK